MVKSIPASEFKPPEPGSIGDLLSTPLLDGTSAAARVRQFISINPEMSDYEVGRVLGVRQSQVTAARAKKA